MKATPLAPLLLALLLTACGGPAPGDGGGKVASIALTPETASVEVGQTQGFTATAEDSSGAPLSASFSWASSKPQVATVSSGRAVGLTPGTTAITAAAGGVTSNAATLTVSAQGGTQPEPLHDTIAYVRPNDQSGDEIRLIDPDGSSLAFVLNGNSLFELPLSPQSLEFGSALLAEGASPPDYVDHLVWGPTPATADEFLFKGNSFGESEGVYLASAGSGSVGAPLVAYDSTETILGLAWLPDASGFVYSVTEGDYFGENRSANLFIYDFASKQSSRITSLQGDFAGLLSVSPDGQRIVFERAADQVEFGPDLLNPDLWLVNRDGSGLELLVENARAPAWSP